MMDLYDYKVIYKDADKQLLVNKTELNYSIVLKEGDKHSRRSDDRVVERMGKVFLSVLAADADFKASCLSVAEI